MGFFDWFVKRNGYYKEKVQSLESELTSSIKRNLFLKRDLDFLNFRYKDELDYARVLNQEIEIFNLREKDLIGRSQALNCNNNELKKINLNYEQTVLELEEEVEKWKAGYEGLKKRHEDGKKGSLLSGLKRKPTLTVDSNARIIEYSDSWLEEIRYVPKCSNEINQMLFTEILHSAGKTRSAFYEAFKNVLENPGIDGFKIKSRINFAKREDVETGVEVYFSRDNLGEVKYAEIYLKDPKGFEYLKEGVFGDGREVFKGVLYFGESAEGVIGIVDLNPETS